MLTSHIFSHLSQGLQIAPYDCVHENASLFFSVTGRYVNHVRLDDNCPSVASVAVERGDGPVVPEAVVAADDAEAHDVALVVEDLEALGARHGGKPGDHAHLAEGADMNAAVTPGASCGDHVAALYEVLVGLRVVEAPHHRPHGGDRRVDRLDHEGAALVGPHRVSVVPSNHLRHAKAYFRQ